MTATVVATFAKNTRETVRVALDNYRGVNTIDVRAWVELSATSGAMTPTKSGISMSVEKLPELRAAILAAEERARELGLLRGDG